MKWESAVFESSAARLDQLPQPELPEVAFSGRSNVGKSSLINRLLNRKGLARTSATPGKTATVNFYRLDRARLVDLPGYGYAKVSREEKRRWGSLIEGYLQADRELRLVLQLIDMRHPPTADDRLMIDFLTEAEIPFVLVLTKSDKLNQSQRRERLAALEEELADYTGLTMVPFSAEKGENADELREILRSVCEED